MSNGASNRRLVAFNHLSDATSPTLGELSARPLADRYDFVMRVGFTDLTRVLDRLRAGNVPLPATMTVERLAWPVAFNIGPIDDQDPDAPALDFTFNERGVKTRRAPMSKYSDSHPWSAETPWKTVWSKLTLPDRDYLGVEFVRLGELAKSVACEQRHDWQHPGSPPCDREGAREMVAYLYKEHAGQVVAVFRGSFADDPALVEDLAAETWSRMLTHWSPAAYQRFLATGSLCSFICGIARHLKFDAFRRKKRAGIEDSLDEPNRAELVAPTEDPASLIEIRQLLSILMKVFPNLTEDQLKALIARAKGQSLRQIGEARGTTRQGADQLIRRAIAHITKDLKSRGYDPTG
jgi:RNA polymerase sigma factor (sigma-70 family)